ncbi:hypothetical protein [Xanthomonas sp. SS]|uniref:hypothetical protein n=1 Tax=Xanthomonas sp. SS TaxID=2724122 RepID=UPI00163A5FD8|nr:hypothetical protein [Xanthomonas sp. SS]
MVPFQEGWTEQDVEAVLARGLPDELLYVPIVITMDPTDCAWSGRICLSLASHDHFNVRGNAVLGFGHLARTCGHLDLEAVVPVIAAALHDEHEYVRGHAMDVADDLLHYLGVGVPGELPVPDNEGAA